MKHKKSEPNEEFVVRFWVAGDDGFKKQEEKSFFYFSKNRHQQAVQDCTEFFRKQGKHIDVIRCSYQ